MSTGISPALVRWGVALIAAVLLAATPAMTTDAGAAGVGPVLGRALPGPLPLFPPDNWWNVALTANDFEVVQLGWSLPTGAVTLSALGLDPSTTTGGQSSTGTVSLSGPAPSGGMAIALASANAAVVKVPATATIAAGSQAASFSITTAAVTATTPVEVTTSANGVTRTATLTVTPPPPVLSALRLVPSTIAGGATSTGTVTLSVILGASSTGTVTLTGVAPPGGTVVTLASSRPAVAAVPASVTVAPGQWSATFSTSTVAVSADTSAWISGTARGTAKGATLAIKKQ